jgi:membrane protease YdiL (CAAX protease family)
VSAAASSARSLISRLFAMPSYPADDRDRRTIRLAGLELPLRATVVVVAVILLVIFDFQRTLIPDDLVRYDRDPGMQRLQALSRVVLFFCIPLLIVVAVFRDGPTRYGLGLGDWRWGLGLGLVGCIVMTPIVLALAGAPDFREYYAPSAEPLPSLVVTNLLDLVPTEFVFRGFLMLALARLFGPIALIVALFPFTFTHLTKPEAELLSTFAGGAVYGWLTWRTGSIWWGALAHTYIVTLVIVAAAAK